jgi:hypothetical protein
MLLCSDFSSKENIIQHKKSLSSITNMQKNVDRSVKRLNAREGKAVKGKIGS